MLPILLILAAAGFAFARRGTAAAAPSAPAAPPPGSMQVSKDVFDKLVAVFGGGSRSELAQNPEILATLKAISSRVQARAAQGQFPAINFGETMGLYKLARTPGPTLDSALGNGGGKRVIEILEGLAKLILGKDSPQFDPATMQKIKAILLASAKRWDEGTAPAVTPKALETYYKLVLSAR